VATDAIAGDAARDGHGAVAALARLDGPLCELAPFAVMTKFVPDALLERWRRLGGTGPPPAPEPSPGRRLAEALVELGRRCLAAGCRPHDVASGWPDVPEAVGRAVHAFCRAHTGFGPPAWEAPGYESPAFVVHAMAAVEAEASVPAGIRGASRTAASSQPPMTATPPVDPDGREAVERALVAWLEYFDLEVWYLRRAFHVAVVPALRALAETLDRRRPDDLLFATMGELLEARVDPSILAARRRAYEADHDYLQRNGVQAGRLRDLMTGDEPQ
jgi:hypothetical protein